MSIPFTILATQHPTSSISICSSRTQTIPALLQTNNLLNNLVSLQLTTPWPTTPNSIDSTLNSIVHAPLWTAGFINKDVIPGLPQEDPFHTQHQWSDSSSSTDYGWHPQLSVVTQFSRPYPPQTLWPTPNESTSPKNVTINSLPNSQAPGSTPQSGMHQDHMYLVNLLHTLPFLFHHKPLLPWMRDGVLQPLDHQELKEISRGLGIMNLNQWLMVPQSLNMLYPMRYCLGFCTTLNPLPISLPSINLALTLILVLSPSHYSWNFPDCSPMSLTILMVQTPVSKSTSSTEVYQFGQVNKGILITGRNGSHQLYQDQSYIPTPQPPASTTTILMDGLLESRNSV